MDDEDIYGPGHPGYEASGETKRFSSPVEIAIAKAKTGEEAEIDWENLRPHVFKRLRLAKDKEEEFSWFDDKEDWELLKSAKVRVGDRMIPVDPKLIEKALIAYAKALPQLSPEERDKFRLAERGLASQLLIGNEETRRLISPASSGGSFWFPASSEGES